MNKFGDQKWKSPRYMCYTYTNFLKGTEQPLTKALN